MREYCPSLICESSKHLSWNLLLARGFLLEKKDGNIFISDNSHKDDSAFLEEIFKKYNFGEVRGEQIIISEGDLGAYIDNELKEGIKMPMEICQHERSWWHFKSHAFGEKVPVRVLEPFVARYVKAISACGVHTVGSCDGNHKGGKCLYIQLNGTPSTAWHSAMWEDCLCKRFNIPWENMYTVIPFNQVSKYDIYRIVNDAAAFIYENRAIFREIKAKALCDLPRKYLRKKEKDEEIERVFRNRVRSELMKL